MREVVVVALHHEKDERMGSQDDETNLQVQEEGRRGVVRAVRMTWKRFNLPFFFEIIARSLC